jgi:hypothetical protein
MKYLKEYKLFESSDYYQKLPYLAIDDVLFDDFLDITDEALAFSLDEVRLIKSVVNRVVGQSNLPVYILTRTRIDLGGKSNDNDIVQVRVSFNNDDIVLCIYKSKDEWFWVSTLGYSGDFKCDQREGLEKLIEDVYVNSYKDYNFNLWHKLGYSEVLKDQLTLSKQERIKKISEYMGGISRDIDEELSILSKIKWAGLHDLNFVRETEVRWVYITSKNPYKDKDEQQSHRDDDGNLVISNEKYFLSLYKNSDNYYLLQDEMVLDNDMKGTFSEFYRCNSFEGVRDAIKFILRNKLS